MRASSTTSLWLAGIDRIPRTTLTLLVRSANDCKSAAPNWDSPDASVVSDPPAVKRVHIAGRHAHIFPHPGLTANPKLSRK